MLHNPKLPSKLEQYNIRTNNTNQLKKLYKIDNTTQTVFLTYALSVLQALTNDKLHQFHQVIYKINRDNSTTEDPFTLWSLG